MNQYWFKPKQYGYGATPTTWEGWAVTGAALAIIFLACLLLAQSDSVDLTTWIVFMAVVAGTVAGLWIISRRKTDGDWRWRWGHEQK